MKKTLHTGALCAAILLSTSSFAADQELYFYNWSEYIPNEVLEDFTKETGIKVALRRFKWISIFQRQGSLSCRSW